ncbi:MAG: L-seryl-tRNA(Sec) selenium transferase [Clostridiales bacterium]|nr:L-seryl-tRNA(Sec) selenium transferase [Clostridiales bacterium]
MSFDYSWLPPVSRLLLDARLEGQKSRGQAFLLDAVRDVLEAFRRDMPVFADKEALYEAVVAEVAALCEKRIRPSLVPVINATGVVLHTNIGRSALSAAARAALESATGYCNVDIDLQEGGRGDRNRAIAELLLRLCGGEDCLVVNNNAAAVLLALDTLANGREAVVSRGELVEIGGSFRVPEVMEKSGVHLREVGTSNKTRIEDYERAVNPATALLLKVHRSNFALVGFWEETSLGELAALGRKHGLPVMYDLGGGSLYPLAKAGVGSEPTVEQALSTGAGVLTFSGDKLLGGPQAGIVIGERRYIEAMRQNPLYRALRVDKLTAAALEATLLAYLNMERAAAEIPTLTMLLKSEEEIRRQARRLKRLLRNAPGLEVKTCSGQSPVGGGALPGVFLPTCLLALRFEGMSAQELARALRLGGRAVLAYIKEDRVMLDLRTVAPEDTRNLAEAILRAVGCR